MESACYLPQFRSINPKLHPNGSEGQWWAAINGKNPDPGKGNLNLTVARAITIGLFVAAIVLNSTKDRNNTGSYRIPIAVQFLWAIILVGGMLILPETPRFLIKRGQHEKAAKSLSRLRRLDVNHPALLEELAEIQANHEYEMLIGTASYIGCFKPPIRKRLLTGCALQALQQLTGVNFIFYYGTSYFQRSGIKNPFIISVITE